MVISLQNTTSTSRCLRVLPPSTPYFSLGLGELHVAIVYTASQFLALLALEWLPCLCPEPRSTFPSAVLGIRSTLLAACLLLLPVRSLRPDSSFLGSPPSRFWSCHLLPLHAVTALSQALLIPHLNRYSGFPPHSVFLKNNSYCVIPAQKSQMALCCPQNKF